jgi:hypothetical protein
MFAAQQQFVSRVLTALHSLVEIWPDSFLVGRVRKILMLLRQFCKQRDNWSVISRTKCLSTSPPPFSLSDECVRSCRFKLGACLRFLSEPPSFKKMKAKAYLKKQKYYRTRSNKKKLNRKMQLVKEMKKKVKVKIFSTLFIIGQCSYYFR